MGDKCEEHRRQIDALFEKVDLLQTENKDLQINLTEIKLTTNHIKERMDNGVSTTVTALNNKFDLLDKKISEFIMPICEDSKEWVGKLKSAIYWIAVVAVGGGFVTIIFFVIKITLSKYLQGG